MNRLKITVLPLMLLTIGCAHVSEREFGELNAKVQSIDNRLQKLEESIGSVFPKLQLTYKISLLRAERAKMLVSFKEGHIKVKELDAQIQELEGELLNIRGAEAAQDLTDRMNKKNETK